MKFIVPITTIITAVNSEYPPTPFASALFDFRLEVGKDITEEGGPNEKYSHTIIQARGLVNVVNSLFTPEEVVFKEKIISLVEFVEMSRSNWEGPVGEKLRKLVLNLTKYGNDIDVV